MINGNAKENVTWEMICKATNNGYDVYRAEIGAFPANKAFHSPLRSKDTNPSFGVAPRDGIWLHKDLSTGISGNCVQFIQQKYNIGFKEAMHKIAVEFGIIKGESKKLKPVIVDWQAPVIDEDMEINYTFSTQKWKKAHHAFWENTDVTESHCLKYETYAVKDVAKNRRRLNISPDEIVWAYYSKPLDRVKLYFPMREKKDRFRGNVQNSYIWNMENIGSCERIFVQKSMKDLLVMSVLTECIVATQNESAFSLLEYNYDALEAIAQEKVICYGSDFQGWHESLLITYLTGWSYYNTPNDELPYINDTYGYVKKYGIKALELHLKQKGFL